MKVKKAGPGKLIKKCWLKAGFYQAHWQAGLKWILVLGSKP